jgi:phosphate:Na+ symporter
MHDYLKIVMGLMGGLGLFLLGMKYMSEGMQAIAGARLRRLIGCVTDNRILGVAIGCLVTILVQSSSLTTVMVVGFVNSGFMTLIQSIGVIFGANIGTTVTAWLLTLNVVQYGLPIAGLASLFFMFSGREKVRYWGMFCMGIGLIFFGMAIMSEGMTPLRNHPLAMEAISAFHANSYPTMLMAVLVGAVFTAIIQASAASLGIAMGMVKSGIIDFPTAAALALGMNIGTTITAYLASLGTNSTAKRAALAHILFNVFGVVWVIPIFFHYLRFIEWLVPAMQSGPDPVTQTALTRIAMVHTLFNVFNTVVFLPFVKPFAALVSRLVPDRHNRDAFKLEYLNVRFLAHPTLGIEQSQKEIEAMADHVTHMMGSLDAILRLPYPERDGEAEDDIFKRERTLDNVQREVTVFLSRMLSDSVPGNVMEDGRRQLRMAHEYESISDYIMAVTKMNIKLVQNHLELPIEERRCLQVLRENVSELITEINRVLKADNAPDSTLMPAFQPQANKVLHMMKEFRQRHLETFAQASHNPLMSLVFADMLTAFRRMRDHSYNIAEVLGGEK